MGVRHVLGPGCCGSSFAGVHFLVGALFLGWGCWRWPDGDGDGRAELDNVSPWAIIAVVVMWCVCVVAGAVVGDAGPGCLTLAQDLLPGEFVLSWCGVGGSVVGAVLCGVCFVAPVARGWGDVARVPCRMRMGLSLQLPGASAMWLLGGSPGTLPCSSLGGFR
ncbi:hypothetical protein ATANTOWER_029973 [Ataeniobius toweri]|uniref:NADH dehydrogenase subunit 6 n=1 Tax=Ataeniobius toweri TaxID=208326 RepID=A0ABU7AS19_9TELE|nr:hypothetical protein [Ataeniobius toweri]